MTKHLFAGETRIASKTESAQLTTPVRNFYHPDHIGSTSYVSDAAQNLVQHERYFPFGERWWDTPDEVTTTNNIKRDHLFTGKDLDRDTGFYYFGARYLDPRTSIWLSPDPILDGYMTGAPNGGVFAPQNLGLYSYSWNNPVVLTDPQGLAPRDDRCYPEIPPKDDFEAFVREGRRKEGLPDLPFEPRREPSKQSAAGCTGSVCYYSTTAENWERAKVQAVIDERNGQLEAIHELPFAGPTNVSGDAPSSAPAKAEAPVAPGDEGTYGELKAQKRRNGETEKVEIDHQPSFAAQKAAAENRLGRPLTKKETTALRNESPAIASPVEIHRQSPTTGSRNNPAQIRQDAANLQSAFTRNRAVFWRAMRGRR